MIKQTTRDKIRFALKDKELSVGQISYITKIHYKTVATNLSAMKLRTKEVTYVKGEGDSFGRYKLKKTPDLKHVQFSNIDLKLSQLFSIRDFLRTKGLTMVDDIIDDYILIRERF